MCLFANIYARDWNAGLRVHEKDVAGGHERDDRVRVLLIKEEHVGPARRSARLGQAEVTGGAAQINHLWCGVGAVFFCESLSRINVKRAAPVSGCVRLVQYPDLVWAASF